MQALRDVALLLVGSGLAVFGVASALRAPAAPAPPGVTDMTVGAEVVEVPMDPIATVDGLPGSISRVLVANGHAGIVPQSVLGETLPPSVVRVLIDHGVTLTVAEDAGGR
ncbi:MAG: hypothetical protein R3290_11445 [Acidimicrobiia bacterium]|nr:hypothetical protein [Acidimicrobiia bacterium]